MMTDTLQRVSWFSLCLVANWTLRRDPWVYVNLSCGRKQRTKWGDPPAEQGGDRRWIGEQGLVEGGEAISLCLAWSGWASCLPGAVSAWGPCQPRDRGATHSPVGGSEPYWVTASQPQYSWAAWQWSWSMALGDGNLLLEQLPRACTALCSAFLPFRRGLPTGRKNYESGCCPRLCVSWLASLFEVSLGWLFLSLKRQIGLT